MKQDPGHGIEAQEEKDRRRAEIESAHKFRFFFVGLVFAILSFAIQFPVANAHITIKVIESIAWVFIAITGVFSLFDVGAYSSNDVRIAKLGDIGRKIMWLLFTIGLVFLLVAKIMAHLKCSI